VLSSARSINRPLRSLECISAQLLKEPTNGTSNIYVRKFSLRAGGLGFFGLGTGYFIWGGQALLGFPKTSPEVNRSLGLWGFWMPGFMQFLTGIYLLTGLTWFYVFRNAAPLYMAGLAFTAYGIHWFAMARRRYIDSSAQLDGWMAIAFLFLSILGVEVFRRAGDVPVMIVFVGLTLIYAAEIPTRLFSWNRGGRVVGLFQFITGI
jgi:hypothetical protein